MVVRAMTASANERVLGNVTEGAAITAGAVSYRRFNYANDFFCSESLLSPFGIGNKSKQNVSDSQNQDIHYKGKNTTLAPANPHAQTFQGQPAE